MFILYLSYDIVSGSNIKPCIKIDKPVMLYTLVTLHNDDHDNIELIWQNLRVFSKIKVFAPLERSSFDLLFGI